MLSSACTAWTAWTERETKMDPDPTNHSLDQALGAARTAEHMSAHNAALTSLFSLCPLAGPSFPLLWDVKSADGGQPPPNASSGGAGSSFELDLVQLEPPLRSLVAESQQQVDVQSMPNRERLQGLDGGGVGLGDSAANAHAASLCSTHTTHDELCEQFIARPEDTARCAATTPTTVTAPMEVDMSIRKLDLFAPALNGAPNVSSSASPASLLLDDAVWSLPLLDTPGTSTTITLSSSSPSASLIPVSALATCHDLNSFLFPTCPSEAVDPAVSLSSGNNCGQSYTDDSTALAQKLTSAATTQNGVSSRSSSSSPISTMVSPSSLSHSGDDSVMHLSHSTPPHFVTTPVTLPAGTKPLVHVLCTFPPNPVQAATLPAVQRQGKRFINPTVLKVQLKGPAEPSQQSSQLPIGAEMHFDVKLVRSSTRGNARRKVPITLEQRWSCRPGAPHGPVLLMSEHSSVEFWFSGGGCRYEVNITVSFHGQPLPVFPCSTWLPEVESTTVSYTRRRQKGQSLSQAAPQALSLSLPLDRQSTATVSPHLPSSHWEEKEMLPLDVMTEAQDKHTQESHSEHVLKKRRIGNVDLSQRHELSMGDSKIHKSESGGQQHQPVQDLHSTRDKDLMQLISPLSGSMHPLTLQGVLGTKWARAAGEYLFGLIVSAECDLLRQQLANFRQLFVKYPDMLAFMEIITFYEKIVGLKSLDASVTMLFAELERNRQNIVNMDYIRGMALLLYSFDLRNRYRIREANQAFTLASQLLEQYNDPLSRGWREQSHAILVMDRACSEQTQKLPGWQKTRAQALDHRNQMVHFFRLGGLQDHMYAAVLFWLFSLLYRAELSQENREMALNMMEELRGPYERNEIAMSLKVIYWLCKSCLYRHQNDVSISQSCATKAYELATKTNFRMMQGLAQIFSQGDFRFLLCGWSPATTHCGAV